MYQSLQGYMGGGEFAPKVLDGCLLTLGHQQRHVKITVIPDAHLAYNLDAILKESQVAVIGVFVAAAFLLLLFLCQTNKHTQHITFLPRRYSWLFSRCGRGRIYPTRPTVEKRSTRIPSCALEDGIN